MSVLDRREVRPHSSSPLVRRTWLAVALVPVGLVLATAVAMVFGGTGGDANPFAGSILSLVSLAAPTAAVFLGVAAKRAGEASARTATVVAVVLLVLTLVALPLFVVSFAGEIVAVAGLVVGVGAVAYVRSTAATVPQVGARVPAAAAVARRASPQRPSRARYWLVVLLPLVAVTSAALWVYAGWTAVGATADTFARAAIPGEVTVDAHPDTMYVYVEGAGSLAAIRVAVTDPAGHAVAVRSYRAAGWYDHGGLSGRAVAKFAVRRGEMGRYRVSVTGDTDTSGTAAFAVGDFDVPRFVRLHEWGLGALLVVNLGASVAIAVVPAARARRRTTG